MISLYEQNLFRLFRHSNQFYFILTNTKGFFIYTNSLFEERSGYIPQQDTPFSILDCIAENEKEKCHSAIGKCMHHPGQVSTISLQCRRQDGSYFRVNWELSVLLHNSDQPEAIGWIGVEEDTRPHTTGKQLQQSELFYRSLITDSLDGILLTNESGIISFASASVKKILGYEPEELLNKNSFDFVHPDDRFFGLSAFYEEIEKAPRLKFINARLRQRSGEWLWCMVRGHNLLSNPHVGAMLIYFCDDTLRRNAEAALMESEQHFRHLIQNLNLGVFLMNEKGHVLICNQAALELLGATEEELTGKAVLDFDWDIIHEDGTVFPPADYPIAVALRTRKSVREVVMGVHQAGNSERVWILVNAEVVMDNSNNVLHTICSFTDITEQKRLSRQLIDQEIQKQKQLIQATIDGQEKERREIGRELHDNISQHLTTTRLYLEVAKEKAEGEMLTMINQAHKGLLDMVNEIRQLSQSLVPASLSDIGLVESIEDLCEPLKNTHAFTIDFQHSHFNEDLLPDNMKLMLFRIIQEQINNIIRHAGASTIHISLETGEGRVVLSIADNGKGFDLKLIKRGLGFTNISNRAGLFGGRLRIDAAPGKGCFIQVTIALQ